jgi:U3 small nucleolar RNA-associated protein 19
MYARIIDCSVRYLPAYLVAAFIKRMSRLALGAPPAALATIIPFIYNLLQTHPACIVLIHRTPGDTEAEEGKYQCM